MLEKNVSFGSMADTLYFNPGAVFEWQGNRIVNQSGNIVDEATGEVVKCDKYTVMYRYNRVQ